MRSRTSKREHGAVSDQECVALQIDLEPIVLYIQKPMGLILNSLCIKLPLFKTHTTTLKTQRHTPFDTSIGQYTVSASALRLKPVSVPLLRIILRDCMV